MRLSPEDQFLFAQAKAKQALEAQLAKIPVCQPSVLYKPIQYEWAEAAFKKQEEIRWKISEIQLNQDMKSFIKLLPHERNLILNIFKVFTQSDLDVVSNYTTMFQPIFRNGAVGRMLRAFAAMEDIHVTAYSLVNDTMGMDADFYAAFLDIQEMRDKHDLLTGYKLESLDEIATALALVSGFGEGLQLFAQFAILMNFPRFNKMQGMGQVVAWSIRDETLHCESMIRLYHTFVHEAGLNRREQHERILEGMEKVVLVEDAFTDKAFEMGPVDGLTAGDVKKYIRHTADERLVQLGFQKHYNIGAHPLPWLPMLLSKEHSNFFEARATAYAEGATKGNWIDTWDKFDTYTGRQTELALN